MHKNKYRMLTVACIVGLAISTNTSYATDPIAGSTPTINNGFYQFELTADHTAPITLYESDETYGMGPVYYNLVLETRDYNKSESNNDYLEYDVQGQTVKFYYNSQEMTSTPIKNSTGTVLGDNTDLYYTNLSAPSPIAPIDDSDNSAYQTGVFIDNLGTIGNISGIFMKNDDPDEAVAIRGERSTSKYGVGAKAGNISGYFVSNIKTAAGNGSAIDIHKSSVVGDIIATFIDNQSVVDNAGAINVSDYSIVKSIAGDFIQNKANLAGGAIRINTSSVVGAEYDTSAQNFNYMETAISGNFVENKSGGNGGAIYISNSSNKPTTYVGNIIANFISNEAGGIGGGLSVEYKTQVGNIIGDFIQNKALYGGGISLYSPNTSNLALIGDITGNFLDNTAQRGGAIYNISSKTGNISGNFVGNSATFTENNYKTIGTGGAIYNSGTLGNISGKFIHNTAKQGGAIYNTGIIGTITADFIGNIATSGEIDLDNSLCGGAIQSTTSITIENSTFLHNGAYVSNEASNNGAFGGAIHGSGIFNITNSTFDSNYVLRTDQTSLLGGGAINIENAGTILNITSSGEDMKTEFKGNYVLSLDGGTSYGGAIADRADKNASKTINITAENGGTVSFTDNYVSSPLGKALGGAIGLGKSSTLNLTADDGTISFAGNQAKVGTNIVEDAIWAGSGATINLSAFNNGLISFDDIISGDNGYKIQINGDNSGVIKIANRIENANVTHDTAILKLEQMADFATSNVTVNSGKVTTVDNKCTNYTFNSLTSSEGATYLIDADFDLGVADTFEIASSGSGKIVLGSINVISSEINNSVIQILKSPTNAIQLALSDEITTSETTTASLNMLNTDLIPSSYELATTETTNDSIKVISKNSITEWAEFFVSAEKDDIKSYTFVNSDSAIINRDIESLYGGELTIKGSETTSNVIDLNGHNFLTNILEDTQLLIEGITLSDSTNSTKNLVINNGELTLIDTVLNVNAINNNVMNIGGEFSSTKTTTLTNEGTLNIDADSTGFIGNFVQNTGTTNVTNDAILFSGIKQINGGTLNIDAEDLYYDNVVLGTNTQLNHASTGLLGGTVDNQFSWAENATGAIATFGKLTDSTNLRHFNDRVQYSLTNATASTSNTIVFNDSEVSLLNSDTTDENGNFEKAYDGNYEIYNTILDLTSDNAPNAYTFNSLNGQGALAIEVKFNEDSSISKDTINTGSGFTIFDLNNIKIYDDQYNTEEEKEQRLTIISGGNDVENSRFTGTGTIKVTGATTVWEYTVTNSNQEVILTREGATSEHSLYTVTCETQGNRFFGLSNEESTIENPEYYYIGESLDRMLTGTLNVYGVSAETSILSGQLGEKTTNDDGEKEWIISDEYGSLFHIVAPQEGDEDYSSDTIYSADLGISNITIENAFGLNGSVILMEDSNSIARVEDSIIKNNTATNNGGAFNILAGELNIISSNIINNTAATNGGALYIDSDAKVNIENTIFTGNGAFSEDGTVGKGGAIYNAGTLQLTNVTLSEKENDSILNDIYNTGIIDISGKTNIFDSQITNEGTSSKIIINNGQNTFSSITNTNGIIEIEHGANTIANLTNSGTVDIKNGTNTITDLKVEADSSLNVLNGDTTLKTVSGTGTISNISNLIVDGDASNYSGNFTQSKGITTITENGSFFEGESSITGGVLNWNGNDFKENSNATLSVTENNTQININSKLTLNTGSLISEEVLTNINEKATVNINGGTLGLNSKDVWNGSIAVTDGVLELDRVTHIDNNNSVFTQSGGSTTLSNGSTITMNSGITGGSIIIGTNHDGSNTLTINAGAGCDAISSNTIISIGQKDDRLIINSGIANINTTNTTEETGNATWGDGGTIEINGDNSVLNYSGTTNGTLIANDGTLNITGNGSILTINTGSSISDAVDMNIEQNTTLDILDGTVTVDNNDTWNGTIALQNGTLNYDTNKSGTLLANSGNLNLLENSILTIESPSTVQDEVSVDIQKGATVNLVSGAIFNLDNATNDKWNGLIVNNGGILKVDNLQNPQGGGLQQTSGSSTFTNNSNIYITDINSYISGGEVVVEDNSHLYFGNGVSPMTTENLTLSNNSTLHMINNSIDTTQTKNMFVNGTNHKTIDIAPRTYQGDTILINGDLTGKGTLNISDFNFIGLAPIDRDIKLQIFDVKGNISDVEFSATNKQIFTPLGYYELLSNGGGSYSAHLASYNPQVFRGQVSTLAMYNNQLNVDDIVLNHIQLQSERNLASSKNANTYASANILFAPYQYTKKDGGLWYKSYVDFERLSMTQNLRVNNTAYGSLVGADLPLINLKKGWDFIPTFYVGYNGSHQSFNNASMYQNGGQGGFMGTFMKNDFIGSISLYGGGYNNEMQVSGYTDKTGNWFAGSAAKLAYNLHPTKHFTIQPTTFISYNIFGKQHWNTDYGVMGMNSGLLNGINVAPGVNLIYAKNTWSVYATFQYMFNINDQVGGRAGNVDLDTVQMRHGYIQYGIGATKTWKERLSSYFQMVFRNGGRTGIGFQLGLNYLFDWGNPFKKNQKKSISKASQTNKSVIKALSK